MMKHTWAIITRTSNNQIILDSQLYRTLSHFLSLLPLEIENKVQHKQRQINWKKRKSWEHKRKKFERKEIKAKLICDVDLFWVEVTRVQQQQNCTKLYYL